MLIPSKDLEISVRSMLLSEYAIAEDIDDNDSVFLQDFAFFNYRSDHILNLHTVSASDFDPSVVKNPKRFNISFFDYVHWYYAANDVGYSNNPSNYHIYYCSKSTGPAWKECVNVAKQRVGSSITKVIGPSTCTVTKVSNNLLKYTEEDNGLCVPLDNGNGCLFWEFEYIDN